MEIYPGARAHPPSRAIDPDDLSAHFNLAILYRRKGMNEEAAKQQALFKTKKDDPGAPTYSLNFLSKHPEISRESIPWHLHTDLPYNINNLDHGAQ